MSFLARFRILTKMMAIIAVLAIVAVGISYVGIQGMKSMNESGESMKRGSIRALNTARIRQDVLALSRAEYNIVTDPRPENVKARKEEVATLIKSMMDKWEIVSGTPDPEAQQLIAVAKQSWEKYKAELESTFKAADAAKDYQPSESQKALLRELETSRPLVTKYADDVRAVANRLNARMEMFGKNMEETYESSSYLMIIVAAAGIVVGVLLGFVVGQFGVIKPIRDLVAILQRMAKGEEVQIIGTERKDEVGDTANAVQAIRVMIQEKAAIEAAEKADRDLKEAAAKAERERAEAEAKLLADRRAEEERAAATAKVMAEFDAAVGGIAKAAMAGDFSQRVPLEGKEGVIRNLAQAMNTMCDNIGQVMDELVAMMGSLANGDLTRRINAEYQGTFATLKDSANATANKLSETIAEITSSAREVANAASEISTSTTDLSQRTEEQAAGLEETSASMEEIAATVKKNAENAQQANNLTASASEVANRGGSVVASTVEAMSRIEESSNRIADIIGVIDEIARQTNLLALNAAVEAARAGDAGRGFAVVATEVRSLAQRSSQAAKDIKDLITNSSSQVKDGVDLVNRTGQALNEIVTSIKSVADIVADIALASQEQSTGIEQVYKALTQMDEVTQQNSALVEENAATAKTLETQSANMTERVSFFRLDSNATTGRVAPMKAPERAVPMAAVAGRRGGPVGRMQANLATAMKADAFEEF
jgi:methyl-accepting chemotaxis protein